jgi:hypothetical protein
MENSKLSGTVNDSDYNIVDGISEQKLSRHIVKGKNYASYINTKEPLKFNCAPCGDGGKHIEAHGFCSDCEKYLCTACFTDHSKGRATRHHTLLDKEYIRWMTVKTCDSCKTTGAEISVEGYCAGCDKYLCRYCYRSHISTDHTNDNVSIDDVSGKFAEKYNYVRDINVKVASDKKNCCIVAMTSLTNNKLVLADQNNVSVKYID